MSRGRVGIREVAAAAGVSVTTVSHVLNDVDGKRVNQQTRARVQETARALGYSPNLMARGLRLQRSQTIALISDEIATTPYAGKIILGAQEAAKAHDGLLVVVNSGGDADFEDREIRLLLQRQVDGILYATMYHQHVEVPPALVGLPVVLLDASSDRTDISSVVPDEVQGGWDAADVLVRAGHRRLAFINDLNDIPATHGREQGFHARVTEAGGRPSDVVVVRMKPVPEQGHAAAIDLLRAPNRPTGIFCFNDRVAMGVYRAAAELGLRVPVDLSVVGFDDQEIIAANLYPGLTTVALPHYEMGLWAAEQLYAHIDAPDGQPPPVVQHRIAGPVVVRSSVAPPPLS